VSAPEAAATCVVSASHYDQSCTVDSDCVSSTDNFAVIFGNYWCSSESGCFWERGAINRSSMAQYDRDVAMTPFGSGAVPLAPGSCQTPPPSSDVGACCVSGQCTSAPGACPSQPNTVLCVADVGPSVLGYSPEIPAVPGVSQWCEGYGVCMNVDDEWQCCDVVVGILGCDGLERTRVSRPSRCWNRKPGATSAHACSAGLSASRCEL